MNTFLRSSFTILLGLLALTPARAQWNITTVDSPGQAISSAPRSCS